ncbi:hypothetical protein BH20ACT19_BH20ACT19_02150 [soil metagenome]
MASNDPAPEPSRRRTALIVEDFRSVRRWLVVLGVLAVVATAVAAYALIQGGESADEQRVEELERGLAEAQQRLGRTSEESEVNRLEESDRRQAEQQDIRRLTGQLERIDRRLRGVERDTVDALDTSASVGRAVNRVGDRVGALSDRLADVEERQPGGADSP